MANSRTAWNKAYASGRLQWRGGQRLGFEVPEGAAVLEVGCGNGKTLVSLLGKGLDLYAVDFSAAAVDAAKKFVGETGEKCELSVQDVRELSFKDNFFDWVFCIHVLGHLDSADQRKAVSEMLRVLKPGGKLYARVFSINDFRRGKGRETEANTYARKAIATHYFEEKEFLSLFSGFNELDYSAHSWEVKYDGTAYNREELSVLVEKKR